MKRLVIFCVLFLEITLEILSQTYSVSGSVYQPEEIKPLSNAHAYLLIPPDTLGYTSVTDMTGRFVLREVNPGKYNLLISYLGYHTFSKEIEVKDQDVGLGRIYLSPQPEELDEVAVTGEVPTAVQIGDTTQYNAAAFKTTLDASADELVAKMPGIVIQDGKVQAQGEDVREVLVDGRPFFDRDPMASLRNLPAEVIDKIQIFDKQSEQAEFTGFDDGETTKTMNLITRVEIRNGIFGKGYAGYGTDDRYKAGGNINFFNDARRISIIAQTNNINQQNFSSEDLMGVMSSGMRGGMRGGMGGTRGGASGGRMMGGGGMRGGGASGEGFTGGRGSTQGGMRPDMNDFRVGQLNGLTTTHALGVNYSDAWGEKVDITGSYFFNWTDNNGLQNLAREYILPSDSGQYYYEDEETQSRNINHRLNLRLSYEINEKNSILIRPRLTMQDNRGNSDMFGQTFQESIILNQTTNLYESDLAGTNFTNQFLFRHQFNKSRRTLSWSLNTSFNSSQGESFMISENNYYEDSIYYEELDQYSTLYSDGWTINSNLAYTEPVGENGMLQLNYRTSLRPSYSNKETFNYDTILFDYASIDSLLSNKTKSKYTTQGIGVGYNFRKDKLNLSVGINYENSKLLRDEKFPEIKEDDRTFNNFHGNSVFRYRFSQQKNLSINYRASTNPPSIDQLQEVIDNSNPLQLSTGNPDLDPTYQHNLFIRYSSIDPQKSRVFFILLSGGIAQNSISNRTYIAYNDTTLFGTVFLPQGSQLTKPVNIDGNWNVKGFITYGVPISPIKSNFNLNLNIGYTRTHGYLNEDINIAHNKNIGLGLVLSSNISENLDFTISSQSNYNIVTNSINESNNLNYTTQRTRLRFKWIIIKGLLIETNLTHQLYSGLSEDLDNNYWLWNISLGKKLFKNQRGEISIQVYDLLKQNKAISRNVSDIYVEDVINQVIRQYVMLTFTYDVRSFQNSEQPFPNRMMRERF